MNKADGKGTTRHKQPINDADLTKLKNYFENNMAGPPSALCLQEIVLFNIIFYMGRRGREKPPSNDKRHIQRNYRHKSNTLHLSAKGRD